MRISRSHDQGCEAGIFIWSSPVTIFSNLLTNITPSTVLFACCLWMRLISATQSTVQSKFSTETSRGKKLVDEHVVLNVVRAKEDLQVTERVKKAPQTQLPPAGSVPSTGDKVAPSKTSAQKLNSRTLACQIASSHSTSNRCYF